MLRATAGRLAVAVGTAVAAGIAAAFHIAAPFDHAVRDAALRLLPDHAARITAVIAIDEASIEREGAWPWPRRTLATLVRAAGDAGAEAVAVDILLVDARPGDDALAGALRAVPSVAAAALDEKGNWMLPAPALREGVPAAHASFELDHDGVLRRLTATKQSDALALAALPVYLASMKTGRPIPTGRAIAPAFRVPPHAIPSVSASDVLRGDAVARRQLRGRIVLIGLTALALGDRVVTPHSRHTADPGVFVHAAAVESLVAGEVFRDAPPFVAGIVAALLVWSALSLTRLPVIARVPAAAAIVLSPVGTAFPMAFLHITFPAVTIAALVALPVLAIEALRSIALVRHGRAAAASMQAGLRVRHPAVGDSEIGPLLEDLASAIARGRAEDVESKRLLAHELKTPLAAMRGLSQVLAGFDLTDEERRRVAGLLGSEAGKLQRLVGGLLELERLALRDFDATAREIDFSDVVKARLELLRGGTDRTIDAEVSSGTSIRGDALLLEHVIDNLVTNAIRYSPAGAPIFVSLRSDGAGAVLEVADRGPGIAVEDRERIFRRFTRGRAAERIEGLGLGLALVTEVVQWHGGGASVVDRPGGGSIFRVRLPRAADAARAEAV